MTPRPEDWPRVREVFEAALALPGDARRAYVAKTCDGDASLRRQVELLLDSHERANSFLETPAAPPLSDTRITTHLEGQRIGPYLLGARIGAGGMGEVYKARDTRLDRTVAIKVLLVHVAQDPQARERFEREARAVAALNHPHICTLHDVGHHDGIDYLVMEHLDGETLAARLTKGALPLADILRYAIEIASALDAAHRAGLVHRDLKPANVMLTKAGAKLLDFGLAKAYAPAVAMGVTRATGAPHVTTPGTILGTVQYMAPEQLEGRDADARSDIWALGVVMYEMVTGRLAFAGDSPARVMSAILKDHPAALSTVQPTTPRALDRVVQACLVKDPERRWQSAADVRTELEWISRGDDETVVARRRSSVSVAVVAPWVAVAALLAVVGILYQRARVVVSQTPIQFEIQAPENTAFAATGESAAPLPAISPDGSLVAFTVGRSGTRPALWVRRLDALEATVIPGTEGAVFPFWAPDSRRIGFFAGGKLKKVNVAGGPMQVLADVGSDARGGSWNERGTILFAASSTAGLLLVNDDGSGLRELTKLDTATGESSHRWPSFLPDGRHFLYFVRGSTSVQGAWLGALDGSIRKRVVDTPSNALYDASGNVLYERAGGLVARPFSLDRLEVTGAAFPVLERIPYNPSYYVANFSVSRTGTLAYGTGATASSLRWYDRQGRQLKVLDPPAAHMGVRLSPDDSRAAVARLDQQISTYDIWLVDLARETTSRFTFSPVNERLPVWSPDGRRIAYSATAVLGVSDVFVKPVTEGGREEPLIVSRFPKLVSDWSADGAFVAYSEQNSGWDVAAFKVSDGTMIRYPRTPFNRVQPQFSPDGDWLAYASDETGRFEVYVQPFPPSPGKWQISTGGGMQPRWGRDGRELFYLDATERLTVVPTTVTNGFMPGTPKALFDTRTPNFAPEFGRDYVVSRDGQRFLISTRLDSGRPLSVHVMTNWRSAER